MENENQQNRLEKAAGTLGSNQKIPRRTALLGLMAVTATACKPGSDLAPQGETEEERLAREKKEKEEAEKAEKERLEKEAKEKAEKEAKEKAEKERLEKEAAEARDREN